MTAQARLVGSWSLVHAVQYRDGERSFHHGEGALGQILYTAEGRMSATLMNPAWQARGDAVIRGLADFTGYAGRYDVVGDKVRHHVMIASVPSWVGTIQERSFAFRGDDMLVLSAGPTTSGSGHVYAHELLWERVR